MKSIFVYKFDLILFSYSRTNRIYSIQVNTTNYNLLNYLGIVFHFVYRFIHVCNNIYIGKIFLVHHSQI